GRRHRLAPGRRRYPGPGGRSAPRLGNHRQARADMEGSRMKLVQTIFRELFGLFVDDGSLAIALLALLAAILFLTRENFLTGGAAALLLVAGALAVLVENVMRSARRSTVRRHG